MPPRISRGATASASKQTNRKKTQKSQKRALNAFTAAQHQVEDRAKIRGHRLGEVEPDRGAKRRRPESDEEEDDDENGDDEGRQAKKNKSVDDDSDRGYDSSGNEWRMGGEIGEDSDSSLDSDEAFGESDEEKFEGFTFRGSSSAGTKKANRRSKKAGADDSEGEMNLDEEQSGDEDDEEEEEEEDDFGDEGVDLATMLDNPPSDEDNSGSEGDTESDDDDAKSDTSVSEPESDSADAEKISKLQDLVASLSDNTTKQNNSLADVHESLPPSDYALTSRQKLQISDLLPTVTDPALRKSLKTLTSDKPSKRNGIPGKLSAPLPKRQQDKIDRSVAAAKAKEELDKWQDTVIHNRRAEHLHFPLVDPTKSAPAGESQLLGISQDKPANDLEGAIQSILEESGLAASKKDEEEDRIRKGEELAMKEVPLEEVLARRAALRKARELLFREEIRAKRIKKIKSKSYRRVHRREREREEGRRRELMGEDEDDEDEREKRDRARAMERVGGKHRESKWAKGMKKSGRTVWDDDAREGVVDMARRNEELRRRIEGKDIGAEDGSDESESEEEGSDFDEGSDVERDRVRKQLGRLEKEDVEGRKGLGNMAFMKRAEAARKAQNEQTINEMRRELDGDDGEGGVVDEDTTIGRKVFGPKAKETSQPKTKIVKSVLEEPESADEHDEQDAEIITEREQTVQPRTVKSSGRPHTNGAVALAKADKVAASASTDDIDAWMTAKTTSRKDKKRSTVQEYIPSPSQQPQANVVSHGVSQAKAAKTTKRAKQQPSTISSSAPDTTEWTTVSAKSTNKEDAESNGSDSETSNPMLTKAQEQELYHARAFAGDDVDLAFTEEKTGLASDEDEKEISNHLPGWGSWTGTGLSKNARRANAKQKHNPLFKTKVDGVRRADRRDAKLKNVIISEAQQRKGKKYLATALPHEFERKDQYERSLRVPIGPEWTTKETFQRNTKPRVVVKQGIVEPLARPVL
ncbi:hypothetical protein CAC42_165 [Sphaceloma murrayae]|uniref:U3 small nucleolar RNA-associated protein 14 n=1 Tax=Sphaceloma murrayae TaxID=2082308 RepID=A0A2K1QN53_9PEZI|nr:hypothetical protein CAC42_165 [Sphaceloma murrayae]